MLLKLFFRSLGLWETSSLVFCFCGVIEFQMLQWGVRGLVPFPATRRVTRNQSIIANMPRCAFCRASNQFCSYEKQPRELLKEPNESASIPTGTQSRRIWAHRFCFIHEQVWEHMTHCKPLTYNKLSGTSPSFSSISALSLNPWPFFVPLSNVAAILSVYLDTKHFLNV